MIFVLTDIEDLSFHPVVTGHHGPPANSLVHLITSDLAQSSAENVWKNPKECAKRLQRNRQLSKINLTSTHHHLLGPNFLLSTLS